MLCKAKVNVSFEYHIKYINAMWAQCRISEFLNSVVEHTGLKRLILNWFIPLWLYQRYRKIHQSQLKGFIVNIKWDIKICSSQKGPPSGNIYIYIQNY
jgi:hypothetical protein